MTPEVNILLNNLEEAQEQTSRTYYLNFEKQTITKFCDGIEAMKQAINFILNTERFENLIYSWNYGIEVKHLIGENSIYAIPEIERVIKEALLQDTRILEVKNFTFEKKNNLIITKFTVYTISGEIDTEKAVSI